MNNVKKKTRKQRSKETEQRFAALYLYLIGVVFWSIVFIAIDPDMDFLSSWERYVGYFKHKWWWVLGAGILFIFIGSDDDSSSSGGSSWSSSSGSSSSSGNYDGTTGGGGWH